MLVSGREVPDHAEGCQFCESGRPGTLSDSKLSSSRPASRSGRQREGEEGIVKIDCRVRVRDLSSGVEATWKIIEGSALKEAGALSATSDVGKALLGRRVGEVATANTRKGRRQFEVLELVPSRPPP